MKKSVFPVLALLFLLAAAARAKGVERFYSDVAVGPHDEGKIVFSAKTNLPEQTALDIWLARTRPAIKPVYVALPRGEGIDVLVSGGAVTAWFPGAYEKGLAAGEYLIQVGIPAYQPENALGENNSLLEGEDVETLANGVRTYSTTFPLFLKADLPPHPKDESTDGGLE